MVAKTREEQLAEWKSKKVRVFNPVCPNIPPKPTRTAVKGNSDQPWGQGIPTRALSRRVDKENIVVNRAKPSTGGRQIHGEGRNKQSSGAAAGESTTREWLGGVQGDWNQLSAQLDSLKRQSLRGSTAVPTKIPMGPKALPMQRDSFLGASNVLPRESLAMPASPSALGGPVFEPAGNIEGQNLVSLADDLFAEPGFVQLCEKGMNARLQRTKDGATAESRINELAGRSRVDQGP
jgi:hypothetical protein